MAHGTRTTNTALWGGMILGLLLSGCPRDSTSPSDDDDGEEDAGSSQTGSDAGAKPNTDSAEKVGTFTLSLVPPRAASGSSPASEGYTQIGGKVFTGPVPEEVAWDVDVEQGGCALLKPRVPFCDPSCGLSVCVDDDQCEPNPKGANVGIVTLSGLKNSAGATPEIKVEPIAASYSSPAGLSLAYPAFDEGAELKLSANGGDIAAFEIVSHGIAPLALTTTSFAMKTGSAFALAWKAPGNSELSRIQIKLDISHHGGTKGKVECDVPDNGSLSIAADLITRLLSLGVSGFPTVVVDRVSTGTTKTASGTVEFRVVSEIEQAVMIDGLTSCDDNADCPQAQTCQVDLRCK